MSKTLNFENRLLSLVFLNQAVTGIGDSSGLQGSAVSGVLYLSLHTADPSESGQQNTYETTYGGYQRTSITRATSSWTLASGSISNAQTITLAQCTSGEQTLTHFGLGTSPSGSGFLLYSGPLGISILGPFTGAVSDNITIPNLSGLSVGDRVAFYSLGESTLPTNLNEGTFYWVKTLAGSVITLSSTLGGATLDLSTEGSGLAIKAQNLTISTGVSPQFVAGALIIVED